MWARLGPHVAFFLLVSSAPLGAEEAAPAQRFRREIRDTLAASINNAGAQNQLDLSWRLRLSSSQSPLVRDAHLSLGLSHYLTPSYTRIGAWLEVAPLSILEFRFGLEPSAYFGTFNSLMSFRSYDEAFDNDSRDTRKGQAHFGTAVRAYLSPTLKVKVGPVAARAEADFEWWRSDASGPLFYEPARDTLLAVRGGRLLSAASAVVYQSGRANGTLSLGVLHRLTYVSKAPANRSQRLGAVAVREFQGRRFGLDNPTLAGNLAYYLDDPFKRHQWSAAVALAFDLLHRSP